MTTSAYLTYHMITIMVIICISFIAAIVYGIKTQPKENEWKQFDLGGGRNVKVVIIDGCEYLQFKDMYHPILHKGNCTNHLYKVSE